jgi:hypothetical protein
VVTLRVKLELIVFRLMSMHFCSMDRVISVSENASSRRALTGPVGEQQLISADPISFVETDTLSMRNWLLLYTYVRYCITQLKIMRFRTDLV